MKREKEKNGERLLGTNRDSGRLFSGKSQRLSIDEENGRERQREIVCPPANGRAIAFSRPTSLTFSSKLANLVLTASTEQDLSRSQQREGEVGTPEYRTKETFLFLSKYQRRSSSALSCCGGSPVSPRYQERHRDDHRLLKLPDQEWCLFERINEAR